MIILITPATEGLKIHVFEVPPAGRASKAVDYTQEQLTERLGVERSTAIRWKAGKAAGTLIVLAV